jgi:methionyl-tRNA synthetase
MVQKYQSGLIGDIPGFEHDTGAYQEAILACKFDRALDAVWDRVRGLNQFIDQEKPWEIAKTGDEEHLREVLASQCSDLLQIADMLEPFLPASSAKIKTIFGTGIVRPLEGTLFPKLETPVTAENA